MKKTRKTKRPINKYNPAIAELGLDPDYYDATGFPIPWTDPESGAVIGGDPKAFAHPDSIQVIGDPIKAMSGVEPTLRELTLDDIEDDCPICQANRARVLAGDPPMVYAYD